MIAGVTMCRNEASIIEFALWHHFDQGCDLILVEDNGSTDGTLEILRNLERKDSRIQVCENLGHFTQDDTITRLSRSAHQLGAKWILPFDADEMFLSDNTLKIDLNNLSEETTCVAVQVTNFIQSFYRKDEDPSSIYENINWRIPDGYPGANREEVENNTKSTLEFPWGGKIMVKAYSDLRIGFGSHMYHYEGGRAMLDHRSPENLFKIYHVPFRSYQHLIYKAEHGRRLIEMGQGPGIGWEAQRWHHLSEQGLLQKEWEANSEEHGMLTRHDGEKVGLQEDNAVSLLFSRYLKEKQANEWRGK